MPYTVGRFGMGIDKPDVRFVVHYNSMYSITMLVDLNMLICGLSAVPGSLEGYYQETGRAGRDGKSSTCVLYYSYNDMRTQERFIWEKKVPREQQESQREILAKVLSYCLNTSDCRRAQVLRYFGEEFSPEQCNFTCDNCVMNRTSVAEQVNVTERAKEILSLVKRMQHDKLSLGTAVDVYYGSRAKKVLISAIMALPDSAFWLASVLTVSLLLTPRSRAEVTKNFLKQAKGPR